MVENCLSFNSVWMSWIWYGIFLIFIISLSLLGLKWLIEESDKKSIHISAYNPSSENSINEVKKGNTEKDEDKNETFVKGRK